MEEYFYKLALQKSPIGYAYHQIILDEAGKPVDYKYIDINPAFREMTGLYQTDIIGKTVTELFPGIIEDDFDWIGLYGDIALNGGEKSFEEFSSHFNRWYEVNVFSPEKNHFVTFFTDISERKESLDRLRESEENLRITLHSIGDAVIVTDADGMVKRMNSMAEEYTGWKMAEAGDRPLSDIFKIVNAHSGDTVENPIEKVIKTGLIVGLANHTVLIDKYGNNRQIADSAAPIMDDAKSIKGVVLVFRDVTEDYKRKEEIRMLAKFPSENPNPVMRIKPDGELLYSNQPANAIIETSSGKMIDSEWHKILIECLRRGKTMEIEEKIGENIFSFSFSPIVERGYVNVYGIDITERIKAEKKLRESEARLKKAQQYAHVGSWTWNIKTNELEWSDEMFRIFGVEKKEHLILQDVIAQAIHPEDREKVEQSNISVAMDKKPIPLEYRIIWPDKSIHVVWAQAGELLEDSEGNPCMLSGYVQDITDRKKVEEELRENRERLAMAVNSVKLGIWEQDLITKRVEWNEFMYQIYDADKDTFDPAYSNILDFTHPDDKERILKEIENVMETGQDHETQMRIITLTGQTRYIRAYAHVHQFIDGKPAKIMGVNTDITDQVSAYNTIIRNQRLNAIGEFASGVAHDFNNSLESILGNIELMLPAPEISAEFKENLSSMKKSVLDAAARIRKLQSFNKPLSGQRNYSPIQMNHVVNDVIAQTRPIWKDTAEQKGIYFKIDKNMSDIPLIRGDENELRSVLYNLIKNAIEAMPNGGTIYLSTGHDGKDVIVRVRDTGMGMDEETVKKMFQPYFTTKGFESGRGLGMSGVLSVIKAHDGEIFVERTTQGEGTVIQFRIPIAAEQTRPEQRETLNTSTEVKLKVLWVDDEVSIRRLGQRRLKMLGHDTDIAGNGGEALELMKINRYDLIITDIGMPVMNGWQFASRIRDEYGESIPIAVLSGGGGDQIGDLNKPQTIN